MKDSEFLFDLATRVFPKRGADGKLNSRHRKLKQIARAIQIIEEYHSQPMDDYYPKLYQIAEMYKSENSYIDADITSILQISTNKDAIPDRVEVSYVERISEPQL